MHHLSYFQHTKTVAYYFGVYKDYVWSGLDIMMQPLSVNEMLFECVNTVALLAMQPWWPP